MIEPWIVIGIKLLTAMLCGGAIGFERELSHKAAGLRTNVLICMGAALYMIVSRHISGGAPYTDPARLAAQVVAGIGFLGAGVILQARGSVHGLTTAATIFVVGAVGISIGEGMFGLAVLSTILIIGILVLLRQLERLVIRRERLYHYSLKTSDPAEFLEHLFDLFAAQRLQLREFEVKDLEAGEHLVNLSTTMSAKANERLLEGLRKFGSVVRSSVHDQFD